MCQSAPLQSLLAPAPLTLFLHLWQNPGRAAKEVFFYCYRSVTRFGRM